MSLYKDIYVSVDIETDGLTPGRNSMLSLGAYAFRVKEEEGKDPRFEDLDTFYMNIQPIEGHTQNPDTMAWWARQDPVLWEKLKQNAVHPGKAMHDFNHWIEHLAGDVVHSLNRVFVGWPAGFDFRFVNWYFQTYLGSNPFGYTPLDIKSYAFGVLQTYNYREASDRHDGTLYALNLVPENQKAHDALADAIQQGEIFKNVWRYARGWRPVHHPAKDEE